MLTGLFIYSKFIVEENMIVDENTEQYLIHSMGLNKTLIKKMLPSEVEDHCKEVIKQRIKERGKYKPKQD